MLIMGILETIDIKIDVTLYLNASLITKWYNNFTFIKY